MRSRRIQLLTIVILVSMFCTFAFWPTVVSGQIDTISEIQEKLTSISDEERAILQKLFIIIQEIEAMEKEEEKISEEIKVLNEEVHGLEKTIEEQTNAYEKRTEDLKQVLQSYQRMGAGSYIKIILESDSLTDLLRRVNILRDIARNTGTLLDELDVRKEELRMQKLDQTNRLKIVEEKQKKLTETLNKKLKAKKDMEIYLASMAEERVYYQEYLNNIQILWDELKSVFSEATKEFSRILKEENLPEDTLKISLTLLGIKGAITENAFNHIAKEYSNLPEIQFDFSPETIKMILPEKQLVLSGHFVLLEDHMLGFEVEEGQFYGMDLEDSAITELFSEGDLVLDLRPIISRNKIRSIEIFEDYLELLITPVFNS